MSTLYHGSSYLPYSVTSKNPRLFFFFIFINNQKKIQLSTAKKIYEYVYIYTHTYSCFHAPGTSLKGNSLEGEYPKVLFYDKYK